MRHCVQRLDSFQNDSLLCSISRRCRKFVLQTGAQAPASGAARHIQLPFLIEYDRHTTAARVDSTSENGAREPSVNEQQDEHLSL